MAKKKRVAVIFGGRSAEHEVSLVSAASVMQALDPQKYEILPIGITREGRWFFHPQALEMLKSNQIPEHFRAMLQPDPGDAEKLVQSGEGALPGPGGGTGPIDVVFPVLHGTYGEDGAIQGLLELMAVPYVGASVLGSAVGMDKVVQKHLFRSSGLPTVDFLSFTQAASPLDHVEGLDKIEEDLGLPVFVKPANMGSSIGIGRAGDRAQLRAAIAEAFAYDSKIIIEKAVEKPREIEVAVLGNDHPRASLPGEVLPDGEFYDYHAKYVSGHSELKIPADLPVGLANHIQEIAIRAFTAAGCSGMARVDFLLTGEDLFLSEVNTIPGFTAISMYPKLWEATGLPYGDLVDELIRLAIERHEQKKRLRTRYDSQSDWYQQ